MRKVSLWPGGIAGSVALSGLSGLALASTPPPLPGLSRPISGVELRADVAVLRSALVELHPGLYRYLTPRELDREFAALESSLSSGATLSQAYLALARFTAQIRCGHTYPNFVNQPRAVRESLFDSTPRLPFHFEWIDRRMIVTRDLSEQGSLPRGTEVTHINTISSHRILQELLPFARADGSNDAKRVAQLAVRGNARYEAFDVYFPLVFPLAAGGVDLDVRLPGRPESTRIRTPMLTAAARAAAFEGQRARAPDEPLFQWRAEHGIAYLRMPTWALYGSEWNWRAWLDERLDSLARSDARALIVDIRGNEGGVAVGDSILQRLIDVPLQSSGIRSLVTYRRAPEQLLPYLDTWDPAFKDWGSRIEELVEPWPTAPSRGYFALRADRQGEPSELQPAGERFRGRLFVLVDATNSSATFQFAHAVKRNRLGTLIGQSTGGNQRGINGGAFFFLRLPNSRIEVDLPLIGYFPADPAPDEGLQPDVPIALTVADIAAGYDAVYQAAVQSVPRQADASGSSVLRPMRVEGAH